MPLLASGPFASSLIEIPGDQEDLDLPPDRKMWARGPWMHAEVTSVDLAQSVRAVGEWSRAQRAWSLMITSDDPDMVDAARTARTQPLVCTGHIETLHTLGSDITAARLAGFRVVAAVVAGVSRRSSGVSDKERKRQKRALKNFHRTYCVDVLRLRRRGGVRSDDAWRESFEDSTVIEEVQRKGSDWVWTLDIPGAAEHVSACGQSMNVATFQVDDDVVMRELPSVLQRCSMQSAVVRAGGVRMTFSPNTEVWPGSSE